jgi:hypothetical protein
LTSFVIEHFRPATSASDGRSLRLSRERAADELAGRAVWCAGPFPGAPATGRLRVTADEPLRRLAERLDAMLGSGAQAAVELGPAEREICAQAMRDPYPVVHEDDVVLLHDALTALLAEAVRERGAHAVWCVSVAAPARSGPGAREAWRFLRSLTTGVDAYVTRWGRGLAAVMPSADLVTARAEPDTKLGWIGVLSDVVRGDRDETVGGTRHPRPAVAAR